MSYPYRYFIARGESLDKIRQLLADRENAAAARDAYKQEIGATELNVMLGGSARFENSVPAGWKIQFAHNCEYQPDTDTAEGRKAAARIKALGRMEFPQIRFAHWLGQYDVESNPDADEDYKRRKLCAAFEKIGGDYIIHIPVIRHKGFDPALGTDTADYEDWITPPDAEPIRVSDYFNRLEQTGKLSNTPNPAPDRKKHSRPAFKPV